MLNRKLSLLHTLVDCVIRSASKVQQEDKLDDMPHSVEMKAKLYIDVLEDYRNNLVQAKDNNANGVNEMAYMLRNIIVSWESKHIWQMLKEIGVDDFGLISIMAYFARTRKVS